MHPDDAASHDDVNSVNDADDHDDPRLDPVDGDGEADVAGMPGELIDTDQNMPGDQSEDDHPPTVSEVYGRDG